MFVPDFKTRIFDDGSQETYADEIKGSCNCGKEFIKVIGSNCTMWENGDRFYYPNDNSGGCIFRCGRCRQPIHQTFVKNK